MHVLHERPLLCKAFLDRLANILDDTQTQCYVYPVKCEAIFNWGLGAHSQLFSYLVADRGYTPLSKGRFTGLSARAGTFRSGDSEARIPLHKKTIRRNKHF